MPTTPQEWQIQSNMDKGFDRETAEALAWLNDNGGRTLRSLKQDAKPVKKQTAVAAATAEARRTAKRAIGAHPGLTFKSEQTAHGATLAPMVRVTITYPQDDRMILAPRESWTAPLADAIAQLPGYDSMCWNSCSITYLRTL